jgi:hypothetical protein
MSSALGLRLGARGVFSFAFALGFLRLGVRFSTRLSWRTSVFSEDARATLPLTTVATVSLEGLGLAALMLEVLDSADEDGRGGVSDLVFTPAGRAGTRGTLGDLNTDEPGMPMSASSGVDADGGI